LIVQRDADVDHGIAQLRHVPHDDVRTTSSSTEIIHEPGSVFRFLGLRVLLEAGREDLSV
jgi:hypothetical protein